LEHIGDKKERVGGGFELFPETGLEGGPAMSDGVEVGEIDWQKEQLATRLDLPLRRRGLLELGLSSRAE